MSIGRKPSSGDVKELTDTKELVECYEYGLFAQCAYADTVDQARTFLRDVALPPSLEGVLDELVKEKNLRLLKYSSQLGIVVKTDTEVVLSKVKKGDGYELVMAFRGTETNWNNGLASDGLTDMKIIRTPVTNITGLNGRNDLAKCWVHNGFLKSFNDVVKGTKQHPPVTEVVKQLFPDGEKPVRVVCCGHSLGGALCTLAAFWCKATTEAFQGVDIFCFAYASPRVGDGNFKKKFDELVGNSACYRFTHKSDVVPAVPPAALGFDHVARPVFLLQPSTDDYGIYPEGKKPELAPDAYAAALVHRPIKIYTSTGDHSMGLYVAALANILGLKPKVGPMMRMSLPAAVLVNEGEFNADFLSSAVDMQTQVAADLAKEEAQTAEGEAAAAAPAGPEES